MLCDTCIYSVYDYCWSYDLYLQRVTDLVGNQQLNMFSTMESQVNVTQSTMPMQMGFPPQPNANANANAPSTATGRVRRELPQV